MEEEPKKPKTKKVIQSVPIPTCALNVAAVALDPSKYSSPSLYRTLKDLTYTVVGTVDMDLWRNEPSAQATTTSTTITSPSEEPVTASPTLEEVSKGLVWRLVGQNVMKAIMKILPDTRKIGILNSSYQLSTMLDPADRKRSHWNSIHEAIGLPPPPPASPSPPTSVPGEGQDGQEGDEKPVPTIPPSFAIYIIVQKHKNWVPPPTEEEGQNNM
jgi:hypothetical protein